MLDSLTGTLTSTKRQPDINEASTRHQRSVNQTSTTRQRSVNRTSIGALCRRERRDVGFVGPSRLAPRGLADHKAESRYRMGPVGWTDQGAGLGRGIVRRCCVGGGAVGSARTQRSITSRWDAFSFHLRHVRDLRSTANDNDDGDVLRNVSTVGPQAPVGAVGYRLVFPSRTPDESPRLSPQLDGNGYQGSYSLTPFQAPYDIRLCDGQLYRVIWTGAAGEIILPKQDGTIPGLRFFLSEATLNAEERSRTETAVGESAAASNESSTDATVIPVQATEQTISRSVDDSSDFLDIPRLADDLRELVLELLDSFQDYSAWYNQRPVAESSRDLPEIDPQKIDQYVLLAQRLFNALDKRPLQLVTINIYTKK